MAQIKAESFPKSKPSPEETGGKGGNSADGNRQGEGSRLLGQVAGDPCDGVTNRNSATTL